MSASPVSRRHLLLGTAVAGASAALAKGAEAADVPVTGPDDHLTVTLKDTPHTRAYYALARET